MHHEHRDTPARGSLRVVWLASRPCLGRFRKTPQAEQLPVERRRAFGVGSR
jgi:hypothetical protein